MPKIEAGQEQDQDHTRQMLDDQKATVDLEIATKRLVENLPNFMMENVATITLLKINPIHVEKVVSSGMLKSMMKEVRKTRRWCGSGDSCTSQKITAIIY